MMINIWQWGLYEPTTASTYFADKYKPSSHST